MTIKKLDLSSAVKKTEEIKEVAVISAPVFPPITKEVTQKEPDTNIPTIFTNNSWPSWFRIKTDYRPTDLLEALYQYTETDKTLPEVLGKELHSIWCALRRKERAVSLFLKELQREKALTMVQEAKMLYNDLPDFCWKMGKLGPELSAAGVNYVKNKADFFIRHAKILERGQINEKMQIQIEADVEHRHLHVNLKDLMDRPISDIMDMDTVL